MRYFIFLSVVILLPSLAQASAILSAKDRLGITANVVIEKVELLNRDKIVVDDPTKAAHLRIIGSKMLILGNGEKQLDCSRFVLPVKDCRFYESPIFNGIVAEIREIDIERSGQTIASLAELIENHIGPYETNTTPGLRLIFSRRAHVEREWLWDNGRLIRNANSRNIPFKLVDIDHFAIEVIN